MEKTIILYGLGQDGKSWNSVVQLLNQEAMILPKFEQDTISEPLTYDIMYRNVQVNCSKESKVNLVGLSLGGVLALNYCLDYPDKVNSLVLINTQFKMPRYLLKLQNLIFLLLPNQKFLSIGLSKVNAISITKSMMKLDFSEYLDQISQPTLLINGTKDKINQKATYALHSMIENSRIGFIKGGHELNKDAPFELAKMINTFYKELK